MTLDKEGVSRVIQARTMTALELAGIFGHDQSMVYKVASPEYPDHHVRADRFLDAAATEMKTYGSSHMLAAVLPPLWRITPSPDGLTLNGDPCDEFEAIAERLGLIIHATKTHNPSGALRIAEELARYTAQLIAELKIARPS